MIAQQDKQIYKQRVNVSQLPSVEDQSGYSEPCNAYQKVTDFVQGYPMSLCCHF